MSGDCGHGWGYHSKGPSGPCDKCSEEAALLRGANMGSCAKQRVTFTIHLVDDKQIVGENVCLTPQRKCPRGPGEGYGKCYTVCSQLGHAEDVALRQLRAAGHDTSDVVKAVGVGHVGPCNACRSQLDSCGLLPVTTFTPDKPTEPLSQQVIDEIAAAYHLGASQTHQVLSLDCQTCDDSAAKG